MNDTNKAAQFMRAAQEMENGQDVNTEPANGTPSWRSFLVDMTKAETPPNFHLAVHGVGVVPSGSITAITGKAKQGKTQFLVITVGTMMGGHDFGNMRRGSVLREVLWCDTEQSLYDIQTSIARLYHIARITKGTPSESVGLHVLALRGCATANKMAVIQSAIDETNPDIVVIDGIRDLVVDFNDIGQTSDLFDWMQQNITARPHINIMCVIHTNDGSDKMRGHVGTELANKCADRFTVTKKDGFFKVEHTSRHQEITTPFTFKFDTDGQLTTTDQAGGFIEDPIDTIRNVFANENTRAFDAICRDFAKAQGISTEKARTYIKTHFVNQIIRKTEKGWSLV